jgi:glutamate transport system substrate-binding protein
VIALRAMVAISACLVLAACGLSGADGSRQRASAFPDDSSMAKIERRGVVTVGITFDQPLFGYKDPATGRIGGFDAEMARMIAADITGDERNVRFIEAVPTNREQWLQRGVVDVVVATYSITAERGRIIEFTKPYYFAGQDTLVRADDHRIRGLAELAGKAVCTAARTTSEARLRSRLPATRLVVVNAFGECLPALVEGRIDAISTDDTILLGLMSRYPDRLRLVGRPFGKEPYGMGVRKGDTVFRDYLNRLIDRSLRDGSWDQAFRDTIGAVGVTPGRSKPESGS